MDSLSRTYDYFNSRVYAIYFPAESAGTYVALHVDDDFIATVAAELNLSVDSFLETVARDLQSDWSLFIYRRLVEKPMYFGMIAIQMYAAYLMDKKEEYGETAYNPRLCQLLKIEKYQLQQLYASFQDQLWKEFGSWCHINGFAVQLPSKRSGAGRYTQYPLSQALLNRKDLKELPFVFDYVGLRSGESLYFSDFMDLLKNADKHPRVTSHYMKVKKRVHENGTEIPFYQRIFSYYHTWDGLLPETEEADPEPDTSHGCKSANFLLTTDNICLEVIVRDDNDRVVHTQALNDPSALILLQRFYRVLQYDMLFFVASNDYDEQWENQRYLERNQDCQIIAPKSKQIIKKLGLIYENITIVSNECFDIVRFFLSDQMILDEAFETACFRRPQVKVKGGLKLSRKHWLCGAGPLLYFLQAGSYYLNAQKITVEDGEIYSCSDCEPGRYVLKHNDHSPLVFFVETAKEQSAIPLPLTGWRIDTENNDWIPGQSDFNLSGLFFKSPSDRSVVTPVRDWITANTKPQNEVHPILIINALNHACYGNPQ